MTFPAVCFSFLLAGSVLWERTAVALVYENPHLNREAECFILQSMLKKAKSPSSMESGELLLPVELSLYQESFHPSAATSLWMSNDAVKQNRKELGSEGSSVYSKIRKHRLCTKQ